MLSSSQIYKLLIRSYFVIPATEIKISFRKLGVLRYLGSIATVCCNGLKHTVIRPTRTRGLRYRGQVYGRWRHATPTHVTRPIIRLRIIRALDRPSPIIRKSMLSRKFFSWLHNLAVDAPPFNWFFRRNVSHEMPARNISNLQLLGTHLKNTFRLEIVTCLWSARAFCRVQGENRWHHFKEESISLKLDFNNRSPARNHWLALNVARVLYLTTRWRSMLISLPTVFNCHFPNNYK